MATARRLRPIYDAIDSCNYRQALKLIRSSESKLGASDLFVALRGLTLQRLGRYDECLEACNEFVSLQSCDTAVLDTMQQVFKAMNRPDLNTKAFEQACAIKKGNEQLMIGLYFAHVRERNLLRQQQVALSLYRSFGNEKYLRWAVLNMELQYKEAIHSKGPSASPRILQLADMMLVKHQGPPSLKRGIMHVRVLESIGNQKKLAELVEGPFGRIWKEHDEPEMQLCMARTYAGIGELEKSRDLYISLLVARNPDDWRCLCAYLDVQMRRIDQEKELDRSTIVVEIQSFLRDLQSLGGNRRGPFLAEIELIKRLNDDDLVEKIGALIGAYYERFGGRACFFSDIRPYLDCCESDVLLDRLREDRSVPQSRVALELMRRHYGIVEETAPEPATTEPAEADEAATEADDKDEDTGKVPTDTTAKLVAQLQKQANVLYSMFREVCLGASALESTETRPGEDLLIVVCHLLIDLFEATSSSGYLIDAIYALENALLLCPAKFQYRLFLIRLYSHPMIGAFQCSVKHFIALDIKQVQLDTLSQLIMADALRYSAEDKAEAIAGDVVDFHSSYKVDAPDMITMAYREDHLDQVLDFEQFNHQLRHSKRLELARSTQGLCQYFESAVSLNAMSEFVEEQLESNQDPTEERLARLFCNADEKLLLIPDSRDRSNRFEQLNRPAPFFVSDSWTVFNAIADSDSIKREFDLDTIRLHRTLLELTSALTSRQPQELRAQVAALRCVLQRAGLMQEGNENEFPATEPVPSAALLEHKQWQFSFLCLESSACVSECFMATLAFIESLPQLSHERVAEGVEDNVLRWSSLHRQILLQLSLFESIVSSLHGVLDPKLGLEVAPYLSSMNSFVNFASTWCALACEVWAQQVPSKRSYAKLRKTMSVDSMENPSDSLLQAEDDIIKAILETRVVLRTFVLKVSTALLQLTTKLYQCVGVERDASSLYANAHVSCLNAFKNPDYNAMNLYLKLDRAMVLSRETTCQSILAKVKRISGIISNMKF